MADLASAGEGPVSLKAIAARQALTPKYLERLFSELKKAGLVKGYRGAAGGYVLARPAKEITVGEIVRVLEGALLIDCIHDGKACGMVDRCTTRALWRDLEKTVMEKLNGVMLSDLALGGTSSFAAARED